MLGDIQTCRPGLKPFVGQIFIYSFCVPFAALPGVPAVLSHFFTSGSSIAEAVIPAFTLLLLLCKNDNDWKATPALKTKGTSQPCGCPGFFCASCAAEIPYGMLW